MNQAAQGGAAVVIEEKFLELKTIIRDPELQPRVKLDATTIEALIAITEVFNTWPRGESFQPVIDLLECQLAFARAREQERLGVAAPNPKLCPTCGVSVNIGCNCSATEAAE